MVICVLLSTAALLWPVGGRRLPLPPGLTGPDLGRRGRFSFRRRPARRRHGRWPGPAVLGSVGSAAGVVGTLGVAAALAGPAGLLAAGALFATGFRLVRRGLADRKRRSALVDIVAGLRMLGRELRAGAQPAAAARNAASAASRDGAVVLSGLAELAATEGRAVRPVDADRAGESLLDDDPVIQVSARLRSGWLLSRRHGVAFTPLIDALAEDLAEQISADAELAGEVAGPRMSGYVMALLPLLGLALGAGMGADPLRVLLSSSLGNILLLAGVTLTCAGLLWSERIVRR